MTVLFSCFTQYPHLYSLAIENNCSYLTRPLLFFSSSSLFFTSSPEALLAERELNELTTYCPFPWFCVTSRPTNCNTWFFELWKIVKLFSLLVALRENLLIACYIETSCFVLAFRPHWSAFSINMLLIIYFWRCSFLGGLLELILICL